MDEKISLPVPRFVLRIDTDGDTIELTGETREELVEKAYDIVLMGVWKKDTLIPPNRIIACQIIEVKTQ